MTSPPPAARPPSTYERWKPLRSAAGRPLFCPVAGGGASSVAVIGLGKSLAAAAKLASSPCAFTSTAGGASLLRVARQWTAWMADWASLRAAQRARACCLASARAWPWRLRPSARPQLSVLPGEAHTKLMKSWRGDHTRLVLLVAEHLRARRDQVAAKAAAALESCHAAAEPTGPKVVRHPPWRSASPCRSLGAPRIGAHLWCPQRVQAVFRQCWWASGSHLQHGVGKTGPYRPSVVAEALKLVFKPLDPCWLR